MRTYHSLSVLLRRFPFESKQDTNIINGVFVPSCPIFQAYVVSKIAHNDWPEQWPNLFDLLLVHLKGGSTEQVHGAMRVLTGVSICLHRSRTRVFGPFYVTISPWPRFIQSLEFVSNEVTDQQFPHIAPVLCPELLRVLMTDNVRIPSWIPLFVEVSFSQGVVLFNRSVLITRSDVLNT
ncbi:hypothetical protein BC938DRAFT_472866 [Jimgerdemannia flammicorona]|uniref:Exportin-1/Importin-beta-like domain-containing protein n=1 Tax=Jimgerdemannia flammicorona TaxID=994334 RepID=A0A433QZV0_9FUNG|nr:hypothetical protein BC938DRAFT_472866 [Jimgerdemannia flammicorona]